MSKLHRLLEKDPYQILLNFNDMIEKNLRVDYFVKSSFKPMIPQKLHCFKWNQRHAQLYRVKQNDFEKCYVQMDQEVPLYSRSIATEDGAIYLIGGFIKHQNNYLKTVYKYDELFERLETKAQMNFPHADHSLAYVEGFIYVIGSFVGN